MKNVTSVDRLWPDREGSTFLEFTLVFPLLMLTAFCTVDFALIMFGWTQANKAVQNGARLAVVGFPVAQGLNDPIYVEANLGEDCSDPATGDHKGVCDVIQTVCTATATDGDCDNPDSYTFDNAAFVPIFDEMLVLMPTLSLQRENVRISYRATGLGFVGRPGGLPMEVTVELRCMIQPVFFLSVPLQMFDFAGWQLGGPTDECPNRPTGVPIPSFATTLTTESLGS